MLTQEKTAVTNPTDSINMVLAALQASEGQLTEQEAAALIYRSSRQFRFLFRKSMGTTFRVFRLRVKMECAGRLLHEAEMPVDEISERLGYAFRDKFERSFKKAFGVTPAQYRRSAPV